MLGGSTERVVRLRHPYSSLWGSLQWALVQSRELTAGAAGDSIFGPLRFCISRLPSFSIAAAAAPPPPLRICEYGRFPVTGDVQYIFDYTCGFNFPVTRVVQYIFDYR